MGLEDEEEDGEGRKDFWQTLQAVLPIFRVVRSRVKGMR